MVEAEVGATVINRGIEVIKYRHIPTQTFFPLAEGKLLRIDLKRRDGTIGYIMGAGDEMPSAIRQMGYSVALLSDDEIAEGNLDQYDVIVAGVRSVQHTAETSDSPAAADGLYKTRRNICRPICHSAKK